MSVPLTGNNARISPQTVVVVNHGVVSDFADDMTLHQRALGSSIQYDIDVVWVPMTSSERQALVAFLNRYRLEEIEITVSGETYVGRITTDPQFRWIDSVYGQVTATIRARKTTNAIATIIAAYTQASVWYDPSDLATMWQDTAGTIPAVPGLPVARIDDKGNLGLHATQSTAANRPTLQRDSLGNYYLQFDGANDALTIPTGMPVPTTGCCAVVAWQHDGYPATNPILYYQRATTADASHQHPLIRLANTGAVQALIGNQSSASVDGSTPAASPYAVTAHLATDNAARKSYLNGVLYGTATAPALTDAADSPTGAIGGATFAGRVYGVVHIQHGIADADRQTLERELMRRAGVI